MRVALGLTAAALVVASLCHPADVRAEPDAQFGGKTITIYVSAPPGGGYDLLFARDGLDMRRFGPLVRALVEELEPPNTLEGRAVESEFGKVRTLRPAPQLRHAR
jgi:hypothetical protein